MGKGTRFWERDWVIQLSVALAYALAYCAIRPFSDAHWSLTSGLRFACLLLIPYRYWLALAVGEAAPLAWSVFKCVGLFGVTTASLWSIPPIAIAMPVVWFCRSRLGLFPGHRVVDMKALLIGAFATSLVWAAITYAGYLTATDPTMHATPIMFAGVFVGSYVAMLSLATWPLFFKLARNGRSLHDVVVDSANSPLALDTVAVVLPSLLVIAFLSSRMDASSASILQMCLFVPVAWVTIRYGWRGAAASGPLAVGCVCLLTLSVPDPMVIQAQFFVAFAVTFLFVMGARIASQIHAQEQERLSVGKAFSAAQQLMQQAEIRMRQASTHLNAVAGTVSLTQGRILNRVQPFLTPHERSTILKDASQAKDRIYGLAEWFHPMAWRERGLPAALRETIGRALDEAGVAYRFELTGRGLSQMTPSVHQAIYRLACESVAQLCAQLSCTTVTLTLRGGMVNGRRWAVLRAEGVSDVADVIGMARRITATTDIAAKLGVVVGQSPSLKAYAELFDGIVHTKRSNRCGTISVLLYDLPHVQRGERAEARSCQLWVR